MTNTSGRHTRPALPRTLGLEAVLGPSTPQPCPEAAASSQPIRATVPPAATPGTTTPRAEPPGAPLAAQRPSKQHQKAFPQQLRVSTPAFVTRSCTHSGCTLPARTEARRDHQQPPAHPAFPPPRCVFLSHPRPPALPRQPLSPRTPWAAPLGHSPAARRRQDPASSHRTAGTARRRPGRPAPGSPRQRHRGAARPAPSPLAARRRPPAPLPSPHLSGGGPARPQPLAPARRRAPPPPPWRCPARHPARPGPAPPLRSAPPRPGGCGPGRLSGPAAARSPPGAALRPGGWRPAALAVPCCGRLLGNGRGNGAWWPRASAACLRAPAGSAPPVCFPRGID